MEADEYQFHLGQTLLSEEHDQDPGRPGRAKPIDLLVKYISAESEFDAVEMHELYTYLNSLTTEVLEDLLEDIKVYHGYKVNIFYPDLIDKSSTSVFKLLPVEGVSIN